MNIYELAARHSTPDEMAKLIADMLEDQLGNRRRVAESIGCTQADLQGKFKRVRKAFALAARDAEGLWFEAAMAQYSGRCRDAHDFIAQKRGPDGECPPSFLDGLIAMSGGAK